MIPTYPKPVTFGIRPAPEVLYLKANAESTGLPSNAFDVVAT